MPTMITRCGSCVAETHTLHIKRADLTHTSRKQHPAVFTIIFGAILALGICVVYEAVVVGIDRIMSSRLPENNKIL